MSYPIIELTLFSLLVFPQFFVSSCNFLGTIDDLIPECNQRFIDIVNNKLLGLLITRYRYGHRSGARERFDEATNFAGKILHDMRGNYPLAALIWYRMWNPHVILVYYTPQTVCKLGV